MKKIPALLLLLFCGLKPMAQYTMNGSAAQISCNEYRLTDAINTQSGSVWNNNKINLTQSFDFKFDVFLGSKDNDGADGIVFVLQPISTSVGTSGGGLGYEGVSPAVGITLDTYQNGINNDPAYDHIAIQLNGDIGHTTSNNLAGPVTALNGSDNIEDGLWHALRIQWDAPTKTISAWVDGNLRVSAIKDFVTDVFSGDPMVFWGFTGSTGGLNNYQGFKIALNPSFHFGPAQKRCLNEPITFFDSTVSFTTIAKYYWDFGDGSPLDSIHLNPVHVYPIPGDYIVKHRVIGADGCEATFTQNVRIGSKPVAAFTYNDSCVANTIGFTNASFATVGTVNNWYWDLGNSTTSLAQNPSTAYLTGGNKTIKLAVKSLEGCESDTLVKIIHIYTRPVLDFSFTDSVCLGSPTVFSGILVSATDPVTNWAWNFDGNVVTTQNASYTFATAGSHNVIFAASSNGSAGCMGIVQKPVFVVNKPVAWFRQDTACAAATTKFTDSSYSTDGIPITQWWWDLGNSQTSTQQNPLSVYTTAGPVIIKLVVKNARGCSSDTLYRTIIVHPKPVAKFGYVNMLCSAEPVQFLDSSFVSSGSISQWNWIYNGAVFSNRPQPVKIFPVGSQTVALQVISDAGCISDTAFRPFAVNVKPVISMNFSNACKLSPVDFTAAESTGTPIASWNWNFGDGVNGTGINTQHIYNNQGNYQVKLTATSVAGCSSDLLKRNISIYGSNAFAGNDTITAAGQPVQLHGSGGVSYLWSPGAGYLNDPSSPNPVAILYNSQTFLLKAYTPQGCESYDQVTITIYKGPDIYLPNAFTPNNDGLNDIYRGKPVGIASFSYLKIYNRYGQQLFYTEDYRKGWDGSWNGQQQENGTYIVVAAAVDFKGNPILKKQSFLLLR